MSETKAVVAIDQELIDRSVEFINATLFKTFYKGYLEIGEYLLKNFFEDDIEMASSKNPNKPVSFQELSKRPDLGVHPSTLSRMLWVAAQERFFVENNVNAEDLSYSHKIEFAKLPDDKEKLELVEKCINEKMSCRKLAADILAIRQESKVEIPSSLLRLISSVDKLIDGTKMPSLAAERERVESMSPKARTKVRERASNFLEKMDTISKECKILIKTIEKIEENKKLEKEKKEREKEERKAKKEKKEQAKAEAERKVKEEKKEEVAEKQEAKEEEKSEKD